MQLRKRNRRRKRRQIEAIGGIPAYLDNTTPKSRGQSKPRGGRR